MTARRGRPAGASTTRANILGAARAEFSERGYDTATVRGIATVAGVDPAMIHHFFGTKEKLFLATVDLPVDPQTELRAVLTGSTDDLGSRLAARFLEVWDSPAGSAGVALLRTSLQHEWSAKLLREFLLVRALRPIIHTIHTDPTEAAWRAGLIATQLVGLVVARYVLKLEPVASADRAELAASIAPTIQRYLTGTV
ncbi:MAG: HTH-type transcriptional repressor AcnR [Glaciihabitans sp.]|nr:HTH-type transcriptional repressor AcnR [Glaciihabitans sp.]